MADSCRMVHSIGNSDAAVKENIQDRRSRLLCCLFLFLYFCVRAFFLLFHLTKRKIKLKRTSNQYGKKLKHLPTYQPIDLSIYQPNFPLLMMIHRGQMNPSSSSSCCSSSSSSSCFPEKHDRPHLYYHITLWASIKKKGLLCLLGLAGMTNALRIVSPAHTHTHMYVYIPADHSTPICSVSKERCAGSTAGLSGLSDDIPRASLTSSVSLSK